MVRFGVKPLLAMAGFSLTVIAVLHLTASAQGPDFPQLTSDRFRSSAWWPTKSPDSFADFIGSAECAKCHSDVAASWKKTAMAEAASKSENAATLKDHPNLQFTQQPFFYKISTLDGKSVFSSRAAGSSAAKSLEWAFGIAHKGQTYLYEQEGVVFESRLSYYRSEDSLDTVVGHSLEAPSSLESSLGRRLLPAEALRCFACHTTASSTRNQLNSQHAIPGVGCEACHGPGAKHVTAMKSGKIEEGRSAILNPRRLTAVAAVDFCGACHRTWADVVEARTTGVANVRFQPYRLENSKCWRDGDIRLACMTCHNPHEPLVTETSTYDNKCLACHLLAGAKTTRLRHEKICPVAGKDCASCHMPRVEFPSMHAEFTDHRIRIVKPGAPYPN